MSDKELNSVIDRAEDEYQKLKDKVVEQGLEIERLNNKLLLIKGIIRTPRALDKSLAYSMIKTQIENVLGSDKE